MFQLFQPRISYFTASRVSVAGITYVLAGIITVFATGSGLMNNEHPIVLILLPTIAFATLVAIWPSYRITVIGVALFWSVPLFGIAAGTSGQYGLDIFLTVLPFIAMIVAISLPWAILCTFIARLRLPVAYVPGHCNSCAYDLRGLSHARCPECGSASHKPSRRLGDYER